MADDSNIKQAVITKYEVCTLFSYACLKILIPLENKKIILSFLGKLSSYPNFYSNYTRKFPGCKLVVISWSMLTDSSIDYTDKSN